MEPIVLFDMLTVPVLFDVIPEIEPIPLEKVVIEPVLVWSPIVLPVIVPTLALPEPIAIPFHIPTVAPADQKKLRTTLPWTLLGEAVATLARSIPTNLKASVRVVVHFWVVTVASGESPPM